MKVILNREDIRKENMVLNSIQKGFVIVPDTTVHLPVFIFNGKEEGKTVLLTAGIHACEYTGIQTLVKLSKELKVDEMKGRVILLPMVNPTGFKKIEPWNVPEDGCNLNRMFPGNRDGTLSEKIAWFITNEFQVQADFYIDLHAGDLYEDLTPYVYFPGEATKEVVEDSREAAMMLNVPYRVKSTATTGAYNSAAIRGVPSLLIERGGRGQWSREEVDAYKEDIYALLLHLGILNKEKDSQETSFFEEKDTKSNQVELQTVLYPTAQSDGLWYPFVKAGERVKKGQKMGEIRDVFGEQLEECIAKADGVVLYMTYTLSIREGNPTVAYGVV